MLGIMLPVLACAYFTVTVKGESKAMAEYIEREALIEKCKAIIQDKWNDKAAPVSWSHAYADFIEDIENQPAADVAPVVHGKWVYHNFDTICSECRKPAIFDEWEQQAETEFCPHCGAKMDGNEVE